MRLRHADFQDGTKGSGASFLQFSKRLVTKSERTSRSRACGACGAGGGLQARYQRLPRLGAGQTLFGNRNKVDPRKILAQMMTPNGAALL
jgi:hypothetical protein